MVEVDIIRVERFRAARDGGSDWAAMQEHGGRCSRLTMFVHVFEPDQTLFSAEAFVMHASWPLRWK